MAIPFPHPRHFQDRKSCLRVEERKRDGRSREGGVEREREREVEGVGRGNEGVGGKKERKRKCLVCQCLISRQS